MRRGILAVIVAGLVTVAGAAPARPGVLVERAWLVPVEETGRVEIVTGPRPDSAAEALYTIRFRYDGESEADGLEIIQRLPPEARYVAGSAAGPGAAVTFSVDGGEVFGLPEALDVPDGEGGRRPATADDYTHIRWMLPGRFPPGMGGIVSYRARLDDVADEPAGPPPGG